ncbi:MAG: hypothetical protein KUG77_14005 [Nannocystaceae bacterium]|nr:hypothetical protein [Nannocystaceae bacterium]
MPLDSGQGPALRGAGRRIAAGLVAAPVLDVADDRGILGGLAQLDFDILGGVGLSAWLWLGFFGALAAAFARLFPAHGPRGRAIFFAAATLLVGAYWVAGGLRLSIVVGVLLLALGLVSWSVAGFDAESAQ